MKQSASWGASALAMAFFGLVIFGIAQGNFWSESQLIGGLLWGKIMLIDLYLGFLIFSVYIFATEKSWPKRLLWTLALMTLGNGVAFIYLAMQWSKRSGSQALDLSKQNLTEVGGRG